MKTFFITGGFVAVAILVVFGYPLFCMLRRFWGWKRLVELMGEDGGKMNDQERAAAAQRHPDHAWFVCPCDATHSLYWPQWRTVQEFQCQCGRVWKIQVATVAKEHS